MSSKSFLWAISPVNRRKLARIIFQFSLCHYHQKIEDKMFNHFFRWQMRNICFLILLYYARAATVPLPPLISHLHPGPRGWKSLKTAVMVAEKIKESPSGCQKCTLATILWYVILRLTLRTLFTALPSSLSVPSSWWSSSWPLAFTCSGKHKNSLSAE